ncbi:unnamed protein product [Rhodiola kirilowii]
MTPFEAVYGRPPPTIIDYIEGASRVAAVEDVLTKKLASWSSCVLTWQRLNKG